MKLTLESTDRLIMLDVDGIQVPARVWSGRSASGTPCFAFITRVVPEIPPDDPRQKEFVQELEECVPPRPAADAWLRVNSRITL